MPCEPIILGWNRFPMGPTLGFIIICMLDWWPGCMPPRPIIIIMLLSDDIDENFSSSLPSWSRFYGSVYG
jgi:hypothetical protein